MKILLVGLRWPPETFLARKIDALQQAGLQVVVAGKVADRKATIPNGVVFLELPRWSVPWVRRIWDVAVALAGAVLRSPLSAIETCAAAVKASHNARTLLLWLHRLLPFAGRKADVVHFEWNATAVDLLPLFDLMACPTVVSCRGAHVQVAPLNPMRQSFVAEMQKTFEKVSAVHCVSQAILLEAMEYGLDPDKACVIRPAVDPDFFRPVEPPPAGAEFRVVTNGSVIWRKGYEYALIAVRKLIDRGVAVQFEIIGDGPKPERQRVMFAIEDLGLQSVVTLAGCVRPEGVRERLQRSHAFLLSSLSEGISNAVLEAMSCGVPVVTTDCGGMAEAVSDGVEGFVTPVRDPDAFADRLALLASDPALRERMGKAGRARVIREFTLCGQAESFVNLYRGLTGKPAVACVETSVGAAG